MVMKILGFQIGHSKSGPQRTQSKPGPQRGVGARIPVHHQPGQDNLNGKTFTHTTPYHQSRVPNPVHHKDQTNTERLKKNFKEKFEKFEKFDLKEIKETRPEMVRDLISLMKGQITHCSYTDKNKNSIMFVTDSALFDKMKDQYNSIGIKGDGNLFYHPNKGRKLHLYIIITYEKGIMIVAK